jgi:hypothetical protein
VNVYKTDDSRKLTPEDTEMTLPVQNITLTEVLRHIEAGRIILKGAAPT